MFAGAESPEVGEEGRKRTRKEEEGEEDYMPSFKYLKLSCKYIIYIYFIKRFLLAYVKHYY